MIENRNSFSFFRIFYFGTVLSKHFVLTETKPKFGTMNIIFHQHKSKPRDQNHVLHAHIWYNQPQINTHILHTEIYYILVGREGSIPFLNDQIPGRNMRRATRSGHIFGQIGARRVSKKYMYIFLYGVLAVCGGGLNPFHSKNIFSIELVFNSCSSLCTYFHTAYVWARCVRGTEHGVYGYVPSMFYVIKCFLLHFMPIKYSWHFFHTFIININEWKLCE